MGRTHIWQLYLMNTLVAAGFWMFWPTITALIQELTPEGEFIKANTFLLAGIQGGWLIAGSIVGFVYEHIGLGGVLLIDFSTYVVSFLCYLAVRKGHHVVPRPAELKHDIIAAVQLQGCRHVEGFDLALGLCGLIVQIRNSLNPGELPAKQKRRPVAGRLSV
jgi:MFS family permease